MLKLFRSAALVLSAGIAAGAAFPTTASADGLAFTVSDDGPRIGLYLEEGGRRGWRDDDDQRGAPGRWDRRDDDRWDRDDRWERRGPPPRCTPDRALDKAARMGLRRVRIRDIDRDTIEVAGRKFGERYVVTFGRAPFCPVISW